MPPTHVNINSISYTSIHVSGIDIIDTTPIYDIKPYHPSDSIQDAIYPQEIIRPIVKFTVRWELNAIDQLSNYFNTIKIAKDNDNYITLYDTWEDLQSAITETLQYDFVPRSYCYTNDTTNQKQLSFAFFFDCVNVLCKISQDISKIYIVSIYPRNENSYKLSL